MDKDTLVDNQINDGQKLVDELPRRGFEVTAAFWLKSSEKDRWRFYIVTPIVEVDGLAKAYSQLHPLIRAMPQPFSIDPLKVKLIGPSEPIARDVLAIHRGAAGSRHSPIRWSGNWLGNMSIDDAYIYPLPAAITV